MTSLERTISTTLRVGVTLAALLAGVGGAGYLAAHGSEPATFGEPPAPPHPVGGSDGLVALGVLVLIATPVVRVALLAIAFAHERDPLYASLSVLVLAILLISLV
jgi:uncharacterized membrane protein